MLRTTLVVAEIDIDALEGRSTDAVVLDVREPEGYAHGHVSGAVKLPRPTLPRGWMSCHAISPY
jgi:rhodanese-related sulfurtransferase